VTDFNSVSRSKFLVTAGLPAGAVLLKGCMGNPPEAGGGNTQNATTAEPVANINPEQVPETLKVSWMDMMFN